jgi:2-methylcitrate dehydratase PrpD
VKALTALARAIASETLDPLPAARFDLVKRHMVDTLGARLAGAQIDEGRAAALVGQSLGDGLMAAVAVTCAQARCTEIDDIHLTSCTTPGSVIVPTVLALASRGAFATMGASAAAALAGYESMIRLGKAIDGPHVLSRGTWPTGCAAAFGSAAAAARGFGLDEEQAAGALATALALAPRAAVPAAPPSSSRWIALGLAAAHGVAAAEAARSGLIGTCADPPPVAAGVGRTWLFDRIGMKPFATARQALAAIEAARDLVRAEACDPTDIAGITVWLPEPQRAIVDRSDPPASRFASIVSVQYQIALALVEPARLMDVRRTPPFIDDRMRRLMKVIVVRRARDLEGDYPRVWPARVDIRVGRRRLSCVVRHPHGDARRPLTWQDVAAKFRALAGPVIGASEADRFVQAVRAATPASPMPAVEAIT